MTDLLLAIPPGMILIVGAFLAALLPGKLRAIAGIALPILGFAHLYGLPDDYTWTFQLFDTTIELVRVDRLAFIFGTIFHLAAFLSALYAYHVDDRVQQIAGLSYAGAAIGAVCAGDLITLFVYWELTALTSVFLIWAGRTEKSYKVGLRYLIIQVTSGVLLLAGALSLYSDVGTIHFGHIGIETFGGQLILLSFGIKAAFPLLHNWVQDAYPEATVTGTVWLSAFTTKLAIYSLCRGYAGTEILIPIGAIMTAFPVFYAVIENDLRRVLAYSLNNQLGFMVVAVGIGTDLAINGAAAHAFAHILYKGLLFMSMGAVLYRTGTAKGSELGGLYKTMPFTTFFCMVGAASISAFPLMSGFVTKSMILTAAADEHHTVAFLVLLFASAGVLDHSGIKIPFFAFFAHDSGRRPKEAPWHMLAAMAIAAAFCFGMGVWYEPLYALLPYPDVEYTPYNLTHVVTQVQLLMFSTLAFIVLWQTGLYPPELRSTVLDTDWIYRRAIPRVVGVAQKGMTYAFNAANAQFEQVFNLGVFWLAKKHRPPGVLGEPWPTGDTALFAVIILAATLVMYYT